MGRSRSLRALVVDFAVHQLWRLAKQRAKASLVSDLREVRPSSFPFVTGDTFRSVSSVVAENGRLRTQTQLFPSPVLFFEISGFVGEGEEGANSSEAEKLINIVAKFESKPVVILHNGDFAPPSATLSELAGLARHVFCVNLAGSSANISAIPIGLENAYLQHNGSLKNYYAFVETNRPRPNLVFSSFAVRNNPAVRGPIADVVKNSRFHSNSERLNPARYAAQLAASKFVLSPPGRGFDCHRTWEAIYRGAVPVVLRGSLAPEIVLDSPIHEVDSFEDFLGQSDDVLDTLYDSVRQRSRAKAFFPYWLGEIEAAASA